MQSRCRFNLSLILGLMTLTLMAAPSAQAAPGPIVISQLFGGGGTTAAGPNGDFVEIFNRSCVSVNLDAYSVQLSSGGSGTSWTVIQLPNFQLDPGRYYCVRVSTTGTGTPFVHDHFQVIPSANDLLLSSSGKAAIVIGNAALPTGACPALANVVDFVKYEGASNPCTEGNSVGGSFSGGKCASRRPDVNGDGVGDGCQDTDVNVNDFLIDADPCVPRNNALPANLCPGAPVFGGCSLETGECIATSSAAACASLGGNYLGDCTACVAPQACCLPTTPVTCVVQSEVECQLDGGVYNPGNFTCPPTPGCGALGRCCSPDGNCVVTFEVLCVSPNTYGGDGTNCNGTPCQGRCCGLDGSCTVVGPVSCLEPSTFGGVGTDCANPELCQGRCCEPDGDCTLTGSTNCLAPNTFGGVGTSCSDIQPFINTDSVIIPVGGATPPSIINVPNSFPIQDVDVRVKIQHVWRADVVICLTHPDGTTVSLTQPASCTLGGLCGGEDNLNAIFNDEGLPVVCTSANLASLTATPDQVTPGQPLSVFDGLPSAGAWTLNIFDDVAVDSGTLLEWELLLDSGDACKGACCLPNTSCVRTGQQTCIDQGGTFNGNGTQCSPSPCAPNGACCIGTTCSPQSSIDCAANNGLFGGVGSNCESPPCFVPCCRQDGTCTQMTLAACNALPFAIAGDPGDPCAGPPCAPVGACCYEDGSCEAPRTQFACTSSNGSRWTEGIGCTPNLCQGRCCFPDGTCSVVFPDDCVAPGEYAGDGTNCLDPLFCQGRCCSPDGTCTVTGPANCAAPSVFAGFGTDCSNPDICRGACCSFNGGECTMEGPANCQAPDAFAGLGSNCLTVQCSGRCCGAGGGCTITSPGQCTGAFTLGQTCDPVQVFQFNDVNMFMVDNPVQTPASNIQMVEWPTPLFITDLNVDLNADHMWPGDVQLTLEHAGISVVIYDRPGVPATQFGCDTDDFNIILDDEGTGGPIETACSLTEPSAQSPPNYTPANALDAFDGMDAVGEWTITSIDFFNGDNGTLLSWSLHVGFNGQACPSTTCTCFGDMNGDGGVSGRDILLFAQCVAAGGAGCPCGDLNHAGGATSADVPLFVTACLTGNCGP